MNPAVDDVAIARWRLRSQGLVAPFAKSALHAVRSLLAIQAENAGPAEWAVAARTSRRDSSELATLLDDGVVLRTHVLRPTWHFVCADDLVWLTDLTGPRVRRIIATQLRTVHGLDALEVDRAVAAAADALSVRGELTRSALGAELATRKIAAAAAPTSRHFMMLLLAHAELAGLICSGRRVDGDHSYALVSARAPCGRRLDRDEALAELALRYATGHGPVTERDLAYWASLTLGDARRGLDAVRDRLERFDHDGRTFWHAVGQRPPGRSVLQPRAHLLQILDECYRGYQDSRWVLDAAGLVPRHREPATGMALLDSQLVATMRRTITATGVRFDLAPYRPLTPDQMTAIKQTADRYGAFLGRNADVVVTP